MTEPAEHPHPPEHAPRPRRVRLVLDRVLSASAGLVALSALAVSVYQAYISRQQLRMSAWPYVMQGNTGADGWAWVVYNVGLGPALIRSVRAEVDARPVQSWQDLGRAVLRADSAAWAARTRGVTFTTSTLRRGYVVLPGATTEMVRVPRSEFAAAMRRIVNDPRVRIRVCYCSLYDDCWENDTRRPGGWSDPGPLPVHACPPADSTREFGG